jgi:hypothetical protein
MKAVELHLALLMSSSHRLLIIPSPHPFLVESTIGENDQFAFAEN